MDFYSKIINLCQEKGVSRSRMADDIGISRSTPKDWETRKTKPQFATLKKIADYFGVPVSYLSDETSVDDFIDYDNVDTSSFNQPVWLHLLEQHNNDFQKAVKAYFEFEQATMRDALAERSGNVAKDHSVNVSGTSYAPITITHGTERPLTPQEAALIELYSKLDVIKQAQLLAYAAELSK